MLCVFVNDSSFSIYDREKKYKKISNPPFSSPLFIQIGSSKTTIDDCPGKNKIISENHQTHDEQQITYVYVQTSLTLPNHYNHKILRLLGVLGKSLTTPKNNGLIRKLYSIPDNPGKSDFILFLKKTN